jgi:hypothetical protein
VSPNTVSVNDNLVLEGSNFSQVTLVRVGGVEASFFINSDGRITIRVPANAPEGLLDLEFVGPFGSLTLKDAVLVKQTVVAPVVVDRRVTIGTFLGRAAVYTKNHEGRRLSIRVGKKWFVIDPLKTNYTIHLTRVGKGKTITVMAYLDRKIVRVQQIKIR